MTALAPHSISMGDDINQWRKYITRQILPFRPRIPSLVWPSPAISSSIFNSTDLQPEPTALNSVEFVVVVCLVYTFPYAASIYRNVSLCGL